jgi:hypothetical protein
MFPSAPTAFAVTLMLAIAVISTVGLSVLWAIFALTLLVTTGVAIHRSIPRKEK